MPRRRSSWKKWFLICSFFLAAGAMVSFPPLARTDAEPDSGERPVKQKNLPRNPFPRATTMAPPLEGGSAWLNCAGPIELSKLKGKVVLLDFWTFCCINCIHVLADLAKLEKEFPNELVVIGVHSAKFLGEKQTQNIREAIMRYEISHPVVNDDRLRIWRTYGVRSWPTQVLIDPEGHYLGYQSGEGGYETIRSTISKLIKYHKKKGTLDPRPLHFELEKFGTANTPLRFPGKVLADEKTKKLFVADSSHHRVVVADLRTGKVQHVIGTGVPGHRDGSFAEARFDDPQGMALDGHILYLADRKNHMLRKIDLELEKVTTLAGDGQRGSYQWRVSRADRKSLASPWDLYLNGKKLYIAMAGTHQIWSMDLSKNIIGPYAGSGREDITDGNFRNSAFAQPSGLCSDGQWLYVADSEVSALRKVGLTRKVVETVIGQGLFEFGDVDAAGPKARLQHALGVAYHDGLLYVADTYNNKIKIVDPKTRESFTFLGDGEPGSGDDPVRFDEPAGLSISDGKIYVADTNNHEIRVIDLATKKVGTLTLEGLEPPPEPKTDVSIPDTKTKSIPLAVLSSPSKLKITGSIQVPTGHKLNPQAPMSYQIKKISKSGSATLIANDRLNRIRPDFEISLENIDLSDAKTLRIGIIYYPCETGSEGVCRIQSQVWNVPIRIDAETGTDTITLEP